MNPDLLKNANRDYDHPQFVVQAKKYVVQQNAKHMDWGWKFPRVNTYLLDILEDLRNPSLILVYRDTIATSTRGIGRIPMSAENRDRKVFQAIKSRENIARKNTILVDTCHIPTLLVSYERAMAYPTDFIAEIASFLGREVPENIAPLMQFIQPGSYKKPIEDL